MGTYRQTGFDPSELPARARALVARGRDRTIGRALQVNPLRHGGRHGVYVRRRRTQVWLRELPKTEERQPPRNATSAHRRERRVCRSRIAVLAGGLRRLVPLPCGCPKSNRAFAPRATCCRKEFHCIRSPWAHEAFIPGTHLAGVVLIGLAHRHHGAAPRHAEAANRSSRIREDEERRSLALWRETARSAFDSAPGS